MGRGYGQFFDGDHRAVGAHRFSWELHNGRPVPQGMQVMHSCDNPPCVNPAHLSVGTNADNRRDCTAKGRNPGNRTNNGGTPRKANDRAIAAMRSAGMTMREIADVTGLAPSTVLRSLRRHADSE